MNKLITEVSTAAPALKDKLQEAVPESFDGQTLTIIIDAEHATSDMNQIEKENKILNNCLRRISGNKDAHLSVIKKNEVLSPYETAQLHSRDIRELKSRAEKNGFIKDIIKTFNGKIVDVWGN
ncbi:MAG TPA: hypothetical protein PK821_08725 [Victivallales bacterium]|nr:hypothetical protein [Victivallales bacterium]